MIGEVVIFAALLLGAHGLLVLIARVVELVQLRARLRAPKYIGPSPRRSVR